MDAGQQIISEHIKPSDVFDCPCGLLMHYTLVRDGCFDFKGLSQAYTCSESHTYLQCLRGLSNVARQAALAQMVAVMGLGIILRGYLPEDSGDFWTKIGGALDVRTPSFLLVD
jgi:hypothetical protein